MSAATCVSPAVTGSTLQLISEPSYIHHLLEINVPVPVMFASVICASSSTKVSSSTSSKTSTQFPSPSRYVLVGHSVVAFVSVFVFLASIVWFNLVSLRDIVLEALLM